MKINLLFSSFPCYNTCMLNKNINIKTDIVDELKKVASIKSDVSLLGDLNIDFVDVLGFSKEDLENLWVATKATEILVS